MTAGGGSAGYSGTPLPRKLGIKEGAVVALVGAPDGFPRTLGRLPMGSVLRQGRRGRYDLVLWFVRSRRELDRHIGTMAAATPRDGMWIAWAKKASGIATDVTEAEVRAAGLAHGIVDYKICAIDATWSGLKFAVRKTAGR